MIAVTEERTGRRIARLFRSSRNLASENRACDLQAILADDSIDTQESCCKNPGYTACLVQVGNGVPPGIILAAGQSRGRRRFSIAHELGHLYIPSHANRPLGWCAEGAVGVPTGVGEQLEWEANDFAAELLMPHHLFAKDARNLTPSFASIGRLAAADQYDVSITAAAVRYMDVTRSACALVSSRDGRVEWVMKSDAFVYRIPWRGDRVPASSVAAQGAAVAEPQRLAANVWLEFAQRSSLELFESTHFVPSARQILSLLWVEEGEGEWE